MSGRDKRQVAPRLRFPDFREAGAWRLTPLSEVACCLSEKAGSKKVTLLSVTSGVGLVTQIEKFGREIAGSQQKNYYLIRHNDFAYNKSATKEYPEGFIALYRGLDDAAVPNSIFTCFRVRAGAADHQYLDYLFSSNLHGRWLRRFITIGARAHGSLNVDNEDLLSTPVPLPPDDRRLAEQAKIATCLASLDDRIRGETKRLDVLRDHKKALIRLLFPTEGKTVPKVRFPEFHESEEWSVRPLSELAENLDNQRIPITEINRTKGEVPYFGASGVVDYVRDFIFDEPLLCISEDGANLVARTTPIAFSISGKTWVNNHAHVLKFESRFVQVLVESYLNSVPLDDFITGMAQPKLNRGMLDTIPVPLPRANREIQKVADCLSSLDELISAQGQKLVQLKRHKKGLMQQLFPVLDAELT